MTDGVLTVLISAGLALLAGIITSLITRRSSSESNETKKLELLINGQSERITSLEEEVKELRAKDTQRDTQMRRIRILIQNWLNAVYKAWPKDGSHMPLPSEEAQELLELTVPM